MTDARLRAEHGFTMVAVLGVLMVGMMLAAASFAAVGNDLPFARASQDRKQAYQAAEAGLDYYKFQLTQDNDFWAKCAPATNRTVTPTIPVVNAGQTRIWRTLPGSTADFSIELVPVDPTKPCDPLNAESTMVSAQGTFQIRSTGRIGGIRRTIVATFRRKTFLDFLYFTDYETSDPLTYATSADRTWATANCVKPRAQRNSACEEISFIDVDAIRGPFHTNDDIQTCGTPDFGRTDHVDNIEISGPASDGWTAAPGCSGSVAPSFQGNVIHPADALQPPATNAKLALLAQPGYKLVGTNEVRFLGDTMTVKNYATGVTTPPMPLPPNGVIYDGPGTGCGGIATPRSQTYSDSNACAVLYVSGTANSSVTLASDADIVVKADITHADGALIGLIANNNVRVYHPVNRSVSCGGSGANLTGSNQDLEIDAAILSLTHTFIVDNYNCGILGTLTIKGAIAQEFRGPVGTYSNGTKVTGYTKNYSYDDKLKYRSPPNFLPPVQAAWHIITSNEQVPAATGN